MSHNSSKNNEEPTREPKAINLWPFVSFLFTVFVASQIASCDTVSTSNHRDLEDKVEKLTDSLNWYEKDTRYLKEALARSREEITELQKQVSQLKQKQIKAQNVRPTARAQQGINKTAGIH